MLYFVLYGWKWTLFYFSVWQGLLVFVAGSLVLLGFAGLLDRLLFRDLGKAAIASTAVGILFLHYGAIHVRLEALPYAGFMGWHEVLIPMLALAWVGIVAFLKMRNSNFVRLNNYLNLLFVFLGLWEFGQGIVTSYHFFRPFRQVEQAYVQAEIPASSSPDTGELPDIYHILVDAHTSFSSLEKYWGYEDAALPGFLHEKGFFLASHSTSPYDLTILTMPAIFQMGKLPEANSLQEELILANGAARRIMRTGKVFRMLLGKGYEIINLSPFDLPGKPRFTENLYVHDPENTLNFLWQRTICGQLWRDRKQEEARESSLEMLEQLKELPKQTTTQPRFVYTHLSFPHEPYHFDRSGNLYPKRSRPDDEDPAAYLDQLLYTDQLLMETLGAMISRLQRPAIILVQGDHGFRYLAEPKARLAERFTVLNAWYFSDRDYRHLYDSLPLTDTYRIILDQYLGFSLGVMEDS